ncbi:hypothetical protein BDZ94DRAFT_1278016 [Collybia nuda]|uniref:Ribonuclease H1 N-terminal domain-containing protein n=1 Tax=Collybia nuda TaxID=64659 RepID=A0A9P6CBX0_9AGAR|nr:hypothetical protein BDZ94DRAFT_1278016 [Collybia nuda]
MAQRCGSAISLSDSGSDCPNTSTRPPTPLSPLADERWYTVTVGRNPGVFHSSAEVTDNVCGIPGGNPARYHTEAEARAAFDAALAARLVRQVTITTTLP